VPINVLTGFLGSGKTTLLAKLLKSPQLARTAMLVNELGEVGLDHLLLRHSEEQLVLLEGGCMCCTLRGDLVEQLSELLEQRDAGTIPRFERVVIETTGLADPAPILATLLSHPSLSERLYIDGVLATVDALVGLDSLERYPESRKQVAIADRLVITKTDLASEDAVRTLEARLRELAPWCDLRRASHGELEPGLFVGLGHLDTRRALRGVHDHDHDHDHDQGHDHESRHGHTQVESVAVTLTEPLDFRAFSLWVAMLTQLNGARILRLKAVISARGEPTPIAVQAVQHVVYPPLNLPPMPELEGRSHVVVLTHGMSAAERATLRQGLLALTATPSRAP
jgi:G3E family GTPase